MARFFDIISLLARLFLPKGFYINDNNDHNQSVKINQKEDETASEATEDTENGEVRDELDIFGENVATKLRMIHNNALREQIENEIDNILRDAIFRDQQSNKNHTKMYIRKRLPHDSEDLEINIQDVSKESLTELTHDDGTENIVEPFSTKIPIVYY